MLHWNVKAVRSDDKIVLRLFDQGGNKIIDLNPLAVSISLPGLSDSDVVETLYTSFSQTLSDQSEMTVRQYISVRAEYRNKILYAEDGNTYSMAENLDFLIRKVFSITIRNLLWCLAILLSNSPENRNWGLVSQFISLYRKVLIQSKVLKSSEVV